MSNKIHLCASGHIAKWSISNKLRASDDLCKRLLGFGIVYHKLLRNICCLMLLKNIYVYYIGWVSFIYTYIYSAWVAHNFIRSIYHRNIKCDINNVYIWSDGLVHMFKSHHKFEYNVCDGVQRQATDYSCIYFQTSNKYLMEK